MAPSNLQHRRTHNLLLISKLLNQREAASPFTLVIDSLEQSAKPLLREYVRRANAAKTRVVYVSIETLRRPNGIEIFIPVTDQPPHVLQKEIASACAPADIRTLLVVDSLTTLASDPTANLPAFLSSLITPTTSLLAVYHADIPLPSSSLSPYIPLPLTLLKYLATTIFTLHSFSHVLACKAAADRSLAEPVFGLEEGMEGVLVGLGSNDSTGLVLEMEYRRKSGRGVKETYFLPSPPKLQPPIVRTASQPQRAVRELVILLEDYPLYHRDPKEALDAGKGADGEDVMDTTFNLGLTEKQRRDREGVVLPYFDAQAGKGGMGGRILYDMGAEDDFDEEEDEI
ncbi:Elongator complex protein 5 [Cryomyces antarcticus]